MIRKEFNGRYIITPDVFVTADTHFGHANIIRFCDRPYATAREMDDALVAEWNRVVGDDDDVLHLGDFVMGDDRQAQAMLSRLKGRLHFVRGNHDTRWGHSRMSSLSGHPIVWLSDAPVMVCDGLKAHCCHYPMRSWDGQYHGSVHLYGHVHNSLEPLPNSVDAGVDASIERNGGAFRLETFGELVKIAKTTARQSSG